MPAKHIFPVASNWRFEMKRLLLLLATAVTAEIGAWCMYSGEN
jgi:hypothetical protein